MVVAVWRSGNVLVSINKVNLRWARLVSVRVWLPEAALLFRYVTNHPSRLSLLPSVGWKKWVPAEGRWCSAAAGVKAGRVLFAGKTVWSMSERIKSSYDDALYKSMYTLLYIKWLVLFQEKCDCYSYLHRIYIISNMPSHISPHPYNPSIILCTLCHRCNNNFITKRQQTLAYNWYAFVAKDILHQISPVVVSQQRRQRQNIK